MNRNPEIQLFELGPTRSARVRWTLLEAGLEYESIGNRPDIIGSDQLRKVHPLGKLPAAIIDGKPLFESAAIATAIADLVPEKNLVAKPGTWSRALHDQWVCFALSEMECWVWSSELNMMDFVFPKEQHVPAIIEQNALLFRRSAAALDTVLSKTDYLIDDRFTVTDIIMGYTLNFGDEFGLVREFPNLVAYLQRLYARPHCTLVRHAAAGS
jgi:glutathione S-transferase